MEMHSAEINSSEEYNMATGGVWNRVIFDHPVNRGFKSTSINEPLVGVHNLNFLLFFYFSFDFKNKKINKLANSGPPRGVEPAEQ